LPCEALGFGIDQKVAARGGLDPVGFGKISGPEVAGDLQEIQRVLPVSVNRQAAA
jgi:hypothetical protein